MHAAKRIVVWSVRLLVGLVLLALLVADLLFMAIEFEAPQRLVLKQVNQLLAEQFQGRLVIESVDDMDFGGVRGARLRVFDPDSKQVVLAEGIDVDADIAGLLSSLLRKRGPLKIRIQRVEVLHSETLLRIDQSGELSLARAFLPRNVQESVEPGRPVELSIESVRIRHAWTHGQLGDVTVDVDLRGLEAALRLDETGFALARLRSELDARGLPRGANPNGSLEGALSTAPGKDLEAEARFHGRIRQVPASIQASFSGASFTASVALPGAEPQAIREIVPELPLERRVSGTAAASGNFGEFDATAELTLGESALAANARVRISPRLEVVGRAEARNFDLRAFSADLPALRGRATSELSYLANDGASQTRFHVDASELMLDRTALPATTVTGKLEGSRLSGRVSTAGGNQVDFHADELFGPGDLVVDAEGHLELASIRRVAPTAPRDLKGRGDFHATGELDRQTNRFSLGFSGNFTDVRAAGASAERARLTGNLSGQTRSPELHLTAQLQGVEAEGQRLAQVDLGVDGRVERARLRVTARDDRARTLALEGILDAPRTTLNDVRARISGHGVDLEASAKRVRVGKGGIELDELELEGAGELALSFRSGPGGFELKGKGDDVDLARIARLLELDGQTLTGRATFDVDLKRRGDRIDGKLQARFRDATVSGIGPLTGTVNALAEDGRIDGDASLELLDALSARLRLVAVRLPENLSLESLRQAQGKVEVEAHLKLAKLPVPLRRELALARAQGSVDLSLDLERSKAGDALAARVHVATKGLELVAREPDAPIKDRAEAIARQRPHLTGIDFQADAEFDPKTRVSSVLAKAFDKLGTLASVEADAPLTPEELLELGGRVNPWQTPIHLRLVVPRRSLDRLPPQFRPAGLVGEIELEAEAFGGAGDPQLFIVARAHKLERKDATPRQPLDVLAQARYTKKHAELSLEASRQNRPIVHARAWADGALSDMLAGKGFVASARARLDKVPLDMIPPLRERQVAGLASGQIALDNFGRDAALDAELSADHLTLGAQGCRRAHLKVEAKNGRLVAKADLTQPDGFLRAQADAGIAWGNQLLFSIDDRKPVTARIQASRFRAGALLPFVHETFSELDGVIDANLEAKLERGRKSSVVGQAELKRGVVQIPAIGQQFRRVRARLTAAPGGVVKIEDVSARALHGRVRAAASARLDGLRLSSADARVRIAKDEPIPVTVQGVMLGEAWGGVDASLRSLPDGKTTELKVKVPELGFELPATEKSKLQELDDAPYVRIGARLPGREFRTLPLQPLGEPVVDDGRRLLLEIELGDRVVVRQSNKLAVWLKGRLVIDIRQKPIATGQIQLVRGIVDVQGKRFEIDQGIITFEHDDPSNPVIVVTARWDSPDGYQVRADYRGRVKNGKLTLSSEPPLSNDQILSLLLFGTTDGSMGSEGGGGDAALAIGVAGGAATKGVNRALSDLTELDVSTRIDTSHGAARPELVLQLSRRLAASVEYAVGEPTPGESPDRTFLTLDLRLGTRWSLATTFGDHGATLLDLLWRYRY